MDPSSICEEQHIIMGRGHKNALDVVLFLQILAMDAPAATTLAPVGVYRHPLDVTLAGEGIATVLLFDEVSTSIFILHILNFRLPAVAEFIPDGGELFFQNASD